MATSNTTVMPLQPPGTDANDWTITAPGTVAGPWQEELAGMARLSIEIRFTYGSAGATCRVCVQSSLDGGNTAYDLLIADFTTAAGVILATMVPVQGVAQASDMSDGGTLYAGGNALAGIKAVPLGDRLRAKIISTGQYANTVVSIRTMAA